MSNTGIIRPKWGVVAVLIAVALASPASMEACAEPLPPSSEKGYQLAERLCKNCHLIEDSASTTIPAGIPTFRGIANKPGQTGEHIMNVLIQPHAPMPDIQLTSDEILNIISYLETLRTNNTIPPLLSPKKQLPKAKFPEPS